MFFIKIYIKKFLLYLSNRKPFRKKILSKLFLPSAINFNRFRTILKSVSIPIFYYAKKIEIEENSGMFYPRTVWQFRTINTILDRTAKRLKESDIVRDLSIAELLVLLFYYANYVSAVMLLMPIWVGTNDFMWYLRKHPCKDSSNRVK